MCIAMAGDVGSRFQSAQDFFQCVVAEFFSGVGGE
jgi:hypothetical protein